MPGFEGCVRGMHLGPFSQVPSAGADSAIIEFMKCQSTR